MGLFSASQPVRVEIKGNPLHCVICQHQSFHRREVQINKLSLLTPDWADPVAICYECDNCGYLHWFMPK
ncbi:hypothetical protein [Hymenobacter metallilatus]|uniref:DNA-binding protein n=1 Tax=Hymenobacter metallilatus TaxID=2493666 RepID=A0A3R9MPR2_9BACT|nr:hypothetical protein [Hymenobacter metallilatus]RSK37604.1 hypothetical protein EI290_02870 [Hymenobacter metallilatus]